MKAIEAIRLLTEERDNVNPHLYGDGGEELVRAYDLALESLEARKFGEDIAELIVSQLMNPKPEGLEINQPQKESNP